MAINVSVRLRKNETSERLIRRFIKKCKRDRVVETYRDKTGHYIKPSVRKKIKQRKAIREQQKLQRKKEAKLFR
jgi:ribosomal protein S21|tara:strand:- start:6790 stop:7011 length:222 start_codon:yes stop_codon:yes gene_type:complete